MSRVIGRRISPSTMEATRKDGRVEVWRKVFDATGIDYRSCVCGALTEVSVASFGSDPDAIWCRGCQRITPARLDVIAHRPPTPDIDLDQPSPHRARVAEAFGVPENILRIGGGTLTNHRRDVQSAISGLYRTVE